MTAPERKTTTPGRGVDADEKALVDGLIAGDRNAVSMFIERTHGAVFAKACKLTTDVDLRQDWTHDTILAILDELGRGNFVYRWPGCFWSWFGQRAHFLLLNQYQRQRKLNERFVAGEFGDVAMNSAILPETEDPVRLLENVEIRATLEHCLEQLPSDDHRRALTLMFFEEMSYEDISTVVSKPINTVRSWIRRGRIALRKCVSLAYELPAHPEGSES